jgi:hypothetical protein
MLKEFKTKECQHKLQHLKQKEDQKEEVHVKHGETRLKRV